MAITIRAARRSESHLVRGNDMSWCSIELGAGVAQVKKHKRTSFLLDAAGVGCTIKLVVGCYVNALQERELDSNTCCQL
jgi:hypothetical protein